ncbi:hypothetical protein Sked_09320 [Sanguibacter keddieii DSM 10542]|uniref:Protein-glutamine gamma-glutamyltransferase-like C-terminal domain-containing protein n=1 Tax=Sanguibacter keddieii (strain ATCC 51767 / DSM 10542 / NCFB 3025 / ST-74) TaxID=446469 RepID=D1BCN4_SANKS|nr:DUF4129 domain-containing protein [Sanguibacter keddieii]ACZ20882.1 hypothetical protein Sked_09320 [Sanguibacter keddieii DSM 10542]
MLGLGTPVDPDATTARDLLRDELTNPVYHDSPSLLERFVRWVMSLFDGLAVPGVSGFWGAVIIVGVVLVVAVVALIVSGPLRRSRRVVAAPVLHEDDTRTADQLVAAAEAHARAGDHSAATLDAFRALVRRSEERALLDDVPGRTADEAVRLLVRVFPAAGPSLDAAGSTFDAVYYGRRPSDRSTYESVRSLDASLATTAPALPSAQGAPAGAGAIR